MCNQAHTGWPTLKKERCTHRCFWILNVASERRICGKISRLLMLWAGLWAQCIGISIKHHLGMRSRCLGNQKEIKRPCISQLAAPFCFCFVPYSARAIASRIALTFKFTKLSDKTVTLTQRIEKLQNCNEYVYARNKQNKRPTFAKVRTWRVSRQVSRRMF